MENHIDIRRIFLISLLLALVCQTVTREKTQIKNLAIERKNMLQLEEPEDMYHSSFTEYSPMKICRFIVAMVHKAVAGM
jgi:hypothetical protein